MPTTNRVQVRSTGTSVEIIGDGVVGNAFVLAFERDGANWRTSTTVDSVIGFGYAGAEVSLVPAAAVPDHRWHQQDLIHAALLQDVAPVRSAFQTAAELVGKFASPYWHWIERVIRHVVPVGPPPRGYSSGSSADVPGLIHISVNTAPIQIGESLVHEAAHQYFDVLNWLGPTHDGSDAQLYYSPLKRTGRPLHFILVAFHAVANIVLYYRMCRAAGAGDEQALANHDAHNSADAQRLAEPLSGNRALTPLGRALFEPLRERLAL